MDRNHLFGALEIKSSDPASRTFEGILSTSHLDEGSWLFKDIVFPGAFKRTLDHFGKSKNAYIPLIDSHGSFSVMNVFGHLMEGEEQLTGKTLSYPMETGSDAFEVPEMRLLTKWKMIDGQDGDRMLDRLRSGAVRKMSMGYVPVRSEELRLKVGLARVLKEVKLKEGSLVVFPMNENADVRTDSVKSRLDYWISSGQITLDEIKQFALQTGPTADEAPAPTGLALTDPKRQQLEERLRDLSLRQHFAH